MYNCIIIIIINVLLNHCTFIRPLAAVCGLLAAACCQLMLYTILAEPSSWYCNLICRLSYARFLPPLQWGDLFICLQKIVKLWFSCSYRLLRHCLAILLLSEMFVWYLMKLFFTSLFLSLFSQLKYLDISTRFDCT